MSNPIAQDNNIIKLYPFNGRSPNLIDKFYIIGFNYPTLHRLLIDNTPEAIKNDNEKEIREPKKCNIEEEPNILNEITADYEKPGIPDDTILDFIFPHRKVDIYFTSEEGSIPFKKKNNLYSINSKEFSKIDFKKEMYSSVPKSYKVVFSSNPHSEKNSKKSINGFAYVFYKKFKEKKMIDKKIYTYYIPYIFCIISEYPYFHSFYKLFKFIKNLFSQKELYIPIEFILYNIIFLSPSPLNSDVVLDLKSLSEQGNPSIANSGRTTIVNFGYKTNKDDKLSMKNINVNFPRDTDAKVFNSNIQHFRKSGAEFNIEENNDTRKKFGFKKNEIQDYSNNNIINIQDKNYNLIKFNSLSGYPLIQYNLAKVLLNNLSAEKIITIFLYTFLEKDVIFFSKDIEYLTFTINAYLNLNFPLNDADYYFVGCAISFIDFSTGNSQFGLKNLPSIIGVNDSYRADYKNDTMKIKDHLVIDLDRGEIYPGLDENNKIVNENNKRIMRLIKRICDGNEDEKAKRITLYQAIKNLNERLKKNIEIGVTGKFLDYDEAEESSNNSNRSSNNLNNLNINKRNREIQEAFYEFIHHVCIYFYENLSIKAQEDEVKKNINKDDPPTMNVIFNKNYAKETERAYTAEELIILDELTDTLKFGSFVYEFLQSYNPIDLYKIPLTFTEEFLSIISRKKEQISKKINKIGFFHLIDSLYNSGKKKEQKNINFDVINFNYYKKYKSYFDREIHDKSFSKYYPKDRYLVKCTIQKINNTNQKILVYQTYELDNNLLLKYLHLLKNLNKKEYLSSFYGSFFVEENILKNIHISEIETKIESYCISNKLLTNGDVCCANIILLFTLSLKSLRETMDCQTFLGILFQDFTVFRKYYSILIKMIYRLYQDKSNKRNYLTSTLCYYPCINSIRVKKLVPNEDLMNMINQFNQINIGDFNFQEEEKKVEIKKDENLKDIKLYGEELEEIPISYNNLYAYHNFTKTRFVNEDEILFYINKLTHLEQNELRLKNGEKVKPKIRFNNGLHKIESNFINQKCLMESLVNEFNKYIIDLDDNKLDAKFILDACLNIFIFMRNQEEFQGKDDIFEVLQCIFYIFMNKFVILRSKKKIELNKK
jgi:hypothetical protein